MPLFDFKCDVCGYKEEDKLVPNSNPYRCPKCAKTRINKTTQYGLMIKQITAPARTPSRWGDTDSCKI